jgi:hypothetical protein
MFDLEIKRLCRDKGFGVIKDGLVVKGNIDFGRWIKKTTRRPTFITITLAPGNVVILTKLVFLGMKGAILLAFAFAGLCCQMVQGFQNPSFLLSQTTYSRASTVGRERFTVLNGKKTVKRFCLIFKYFSLLTHFYLTDRVEASNRYCEERFDMLMSSGSICPEQPYFFRLQSSQSQQK